MPIARRQTEISARIGHAPPEVSASAVIAWYPEIEVFAMRSYSNRDGVVVLLVTTNADKISHVLTAAGFQCEVNSVVLIGPLDRSGWAAPIGVRLANAGIDVLNFYASHKEHGQRYLVFKTSDDDHAIQVLTGGPPSQSLACSNTPRDQEMAIADGFSPFRQTRGWLPD